MQRVRVLLCTLLCLAFYGRMPGQQLQPSSLKSAGLRSIGHHGGFLAAAYLPDGNVVVLENEGDGLRLFKTDPKLTTVLAEAHQGANGDAGVALSLDPQGNIYVGGTSSSGLLVGSPGAAYRSSADASLNSFVAKFDNDLNLIFLTFLGAGRTALTGIAATNDAVFATGVSYSAALPVAAGVVQGSPTSTVDAGTGFVVGLSSDGGTLGYATYIGGTDSTSTPEAIAADAADNVYIAGSTSNPLMPVVSALQPWMMGATSGFVAKLSPDGSHYAFSSFIAGKGLTGIALDGATGTLLLSGNLSFSGFPVQNVAAPVAATPYQSLLRLSADGQQMLGSTLLFPGEESHVIAAPEGSAWIAGSLSAPLTEQERGAGLGDGAVVHVSNSGVIDTVLRTGGTATSNASAASLTSTPGVPAISSDGSALLLPSTLKATTEPSLAPGQSFDLTLTGPASALLPSQLSDALPTDCTTASQCSGTAGLLAQYGPANGQASLGVSSSDFPLITLRNLGTTTATGLDVTASGFVSSTSCGQSLLPQAQCGVFLSGPGPGSFSITASNASPETLTFPASTGRTAQSLAFDVAGLDFGIVPSASPASRTITVSNLSSQAQSFLSAADAVPTSAAYQLAESASTCSGSAGAHTIAAHATCTVTITLSASSCSTNDGPVQAAWKLGTRDVPVSGYAQAASLTVSSPTIDFGPQLATQTDRLPRYLYLSNISPMPAAHSPVTLPADSPFQVSDGCASTLEPNSVCQITLAYLQSAAPSFDTATLQLDQGLTIVIIGETRTELPAISALPSPLVVTPSAVQFTTAVPVSELSTETQTVQITNPTGGPLPLNVELLGDFKLASTCGATLSAGGTCGVTLQFAPTQAGLREGSLSLSTGAGFAPVSLSVTGTATALISVPDEPLVLPETPVGEPVVSWFQLQTSVPQLTVTVSGTGFSTVVLQDDGNGHGTINASAFTSQIAGPCYRCWVGVQYFPQAPGAAAGTLQLTTAASGTSYELGLQAFGLPTQGVLLSPAEADFGAVPVHSSSAPLTFTLTDMLPTIAATIQSVTATGDFSVVPDTRVTACHGAIFPTTACGVQLAFTPSGTGPRSGRLTVTTDQGTVSADLSGTGTPDPGLAISPTALTFQQAGTATLSITNTGRIALNIGFPTASSGAYTVTSGCQILAPGGGCNLTVTFVPGQSQTAATLTIPVSFLDDMGQMESSSYAVPLSTSGGSGLSVFPATADFGASATGSLGQVREFSLTNTTSAPVNVSLSASRDFPLAAPSACGALAPSATCTFSVLFSPQTAGPLTGSVTVSAGMGMQSVLYLQGYGKAAGKLTVSSGSDPQSPIAFGQVLSEQSSAQPLTITNSGTSPLTIRRITSTAPFQTSSTCASTLSPGESCNATITYAPQALVSSIASQSPRSETGTLLIESDAQSSPDTVYLTGTVVPSTSSTGSTGALPGYTLSASALTFPNTPPGSTSPAQTLTLTNTGTVPVVVSSVTVPGDFRAVSHCSTVAPGASCSVELTFAPLVNTTSPVRTGTLRFASNAGVALDFVSLLGSAAATSLQVSPSTQDFGAVLLGASSQRTFTLTNETTLPLSPGNLQLSDDFSVSSTNCPPNGGAIAAGQSCTVTISYAPTRTGAHTGTLSIPRPGTSLAVVATLSGTGLAGKLQATPTSLSFGTVQLGSSAAQTIQLTNVGTAALTAIQLSLAGSAASSFAAQSTCSDSPFAIGATCTVQITYTATQSGPQNASLVLASSDPAGPLQVPLFGTGSQPPGFGLTVNGAAIATATMNSGATANFALLLTPVGGYTGPVAITCAPVNAAPNGSCSLSNAQLKLSSEADPATASITTLSGLEGAAVAPWLWICLPLLTYGSKKDRRSRTAILCALFALSVLTSCVLGCGGGAGSRGAPYTPPGTYSYQVTASSVSGAALHSSVTLTVVVE